ncbi:MAG: type II toxin-antitoxin system ParD family antitoxin [Rhodospirillaceae bacterium]|jgi:antitoxin ParD1/3/4|nr:type II toxin-antitoxin system ParD family antitoxin [Rhodospirillaceae bacterium]MBT7956809.1 type II toxin-antitoxin system ParD family antitoxin [Rhodospirillaceae bacterium]
MPRQSITLSEPNHSWIVEKLESKEFKSNSEVVNDALRKIRELEQIKVEAIRAALIEGEESGVSDRTPDDIMEAVIKRKQNNGSL